MFTAFIFMLRAIYMPPYFRCAFFAHLYYTLYRYFHYYVDILLISHFAGFSLIFIAPPSASSDYQYD